MELSKNAYTKYIETSPGPRLLHAKSIMSDIYLAKGEVSIKAGNYPLAVQDVEAALDMKITGPEDSRSLAEALYQLRVAQAHAGNVMESDVSLGNATVVLGKRKKNLEKLGSSHSID